MVTRTKKIFVGGLSAPTTLEDVKNYFEQFGRVRHSTVQPYNGAGVGGHHSIFDFFLFHYCSLLLKWGLKLAVHNVPNLLLGLYVVVLIPRQLCCGLWLADTPIADYHGPIAGQHTTWRGKSTTTWSPATQRDPCVLLLLSSGLTSTHTARNIQRLLSIDFGW